MDFNKLSRKQLQALCKKNKIPANVTNLAMAEALAALHKVEGLDEILNPVEDDEQQFQEEKVVGTPDAHCKASTTSTRRKDVNVPATPAMPSSRRRAPSISTRRMKEAQIPEDEENGGQGKPTGVPITPAAPTTRTRAYNTRRSVRLLEKNLSRMNLLDTEDMGLVKIDDVSEDTTNVSQQTEMSAEIEGKKTEGLEVTSQAKNTEHELGSGLDGVVGVSLHAEPKDSNLKLDGSSETYNCSNEVCDKPVGKAVHATDEAEAGLLSQLEGSFDSIERENKTFLGTKQDGSTEVSEEASVEATNHDVDAFSFAVEIPDCASMEVTGQEIVGSLPKSSVNKTDNRCGNDSAEIDSLSNEVSEDAFTEVIDQDVAALAIEAPDASVEATGQEDIAGLLLSSSVSNNSVILEGSVTCKTVKHDGNDFAEISALSVESEDTEMEATGQDVPAFSVDVTDQYVTDLSVEIPVEASMEVTVQDIAGSLSVSSVRDDSVSLKELVPCNTANSSDSTEISDTSMFLLIRNANTLVDGDVIPEEIAIPEQECSISSEIMKHEKSSSTEVPLSKMDEVRLSTMTVATIYEQLKGESHCPAQSGPKDVADERIQWDKIHLMKENTNTYESMSIRELKKLLKNLTLDCKSNSKNNNVAKEVDKIRPALQMLPENRMTSGVWKNDG